MSVARIIIYVTTFALLAFSGVLWIGVVHPPHPINQKADGAAAKAEASLPTHPTVLETDSNIVSVPTPSPSASVVLLPEEEGFRNVPMPSFENPQAQSDAQKYVSELEQIRQIQAAPPSGLDDPVANSAFLNNLGNHLDALSRARDGVLLNSSPQERARWKAFNKSLDKRETDE